MPTNDILVATPEETQRLVFGKDTTDRIVSIENKGDKLYIYRQLPNGKIELTTRPSLFWFITNQRVSSKQTTLEGNQHYKYLGTFSTQEERDKVVGTLKKHNIDFYRIFDQKEATLVYNGMTYFKGLKPTEVSALSFDIETSTLQHNSYSTVMMITNTFRRPDGKIIRKMFDLASYKGDEKAMILAWTKWVRIVDPSIMLGHNILSFDIPYLQFRAKELGIWLDLGRDGSSIKFDKWSSFKRVDGTQEIEYTNCYIFGREIVDTMFLAITFDALKKFPSYGLKPIIKFLDMEKQGRTFVDPKKMWEYYSDFITNTGKPEMWLLAKEYANDDSDDGLKLFDHMIPAYFVFTQSVSKSFQAMTTSATGSQINNMLVRSYLQNGHSIAKATEILEKVAGGISFAVPGIYSNVFKVDIKSCYPSQILRFKLYDKKKDPNAHFYKIVHYFTYQRFHYKDMLKSTGDDHWKFMDAAAKIVINSAYGTTITVGLNYNSPTIGSKITGESRKIIDLALTWASGKDSTHWFEVFYEKTGRKPDDEIEDVDEAFAV